MHSVLKNIVSCVSINGGFYTRRCLKPNVGRAYKILFLASTEPEKISVNP